MGKISDYTTLSSADDGDYVPIVDVSDTTQGAAGSLKKIAKSAILASNIIGPATSTDNGIVRFDGTTGKLVQDSSGPIIGNNGVVIFRTSNNDTPVQLNNTISSGSNAPVANELNFKPDEGGSIVYGYGVISWYADDYTIKDVIMQTHRALDSDSSNLHRHFSLYSSNAARDSTIKRFNVQYGVDNALMDFQNTFLTMDTFGDNIGLTITSTGATKQTAKFSNTQISSTGAVLGLTNSGGGPLISGTSASTTNAAIDIISEFGYRHQMNTTGGYGLNLFTDATHTVSSTFGLARIANLTVADTNPVLSIDNRSSGKSLYINNNGTEKFSVSSAGVATMAANPVITNATTPSSASDTGVAGTIAWDTSFIYICTATNTWKRVAIATW